MVIKEMHLQENKLFDLDPEVVMTYAPEKFEVAMSDGYGGEAFARKSIS